MITEINFEIRQMEDRDATSVIEIFQYGIDTKNATFDLQVPTWDYWNKTHFEKCRFVMQTQDDKIIGWCALKPTSDRECFKGVAEVSIYLHKDFLNRGLGKLLLRKLILSSEENGFWTLQSGIFPENIGSIKLHEGLNFRQVGIRQKIAQMDGIWRDIVLMERRSDVVGF